MMEAAVIDCLPQGLLPYPVEISEAYASPHSHRGALTTIPFSAPRLGG